MRVAVYTAFFRAWAYVRSAISPRTIWHLIIACGRGVGRSAAWSVRFVNAESKSELKEANPTKHHEETVRRRWAYFFMLTSWIGFWVFLIAGTGSVGRAFAAFNVHVPPGGFGAVAAVLCLLVHTIGFIQVGRTDVLMVKVQTARMVGEMMIRNIVDELTMTVAQRNKELTSAIVAPPARLASNKGYEVTVRVNSEGKPERIFSDPAGVAHKLRKGKSEVFVYEVRGDASCVRILVLDTDPWSQKPTRNPLAVKPRMVNLWQEEINLGTHPDYTAFTRRLAEEGDGGGMLCGGAPRQGKSIFVSNVLVPIMLDPTAHLHIVDGSAVDFAAIRPICDSFVGEAEMDDVQVLRMAHDVLRKLKKEVARRKSFLLSKGVTKLSERLAYEFDMGPHYFVCDELAVITEDLMAKHKDAVQAFLEDLQWLVRGGPKYGVMCILATQRPSEKSVPPSLKSLILFRVAFYIGDQSGSMAIMGKAGPAFRADWLTPGQKGVGIAIGDGQFRGHMITNEELERICRFGMSLRAAHRQGSRPEPETAAEWPEPVRTIMTIIDRLQVQEIETSRLVLELQNQGFVTVDASKLAKSLRIFGISPVRFYVDKIQKRGYLRSQFESVSRIVYTATQPDSETFEDGFLDAEEDGPEDMAARTRPTEKD